uniref:Sulfotransferase n=1 Tax=Marmota marmota marmota TaxID=9994 RepID=A0A8C5ZQT7_MARMA
MLCRGAHRSPASMYHSHHDLSGTQSQGHTCVDGPAPEQTGILVDVPAMFCSMLPWDLEDHLLLNNTHTNTQRLSPQVWEKADFPFSPHLVWVDQRGSDGLWYQQLSKNTAVHIIDMLGPTESSPPQH